MTPQIIKEIIEETLIELRIPGPLRRQIIRGIMERLG